MFRHFVVHLMLVGQLRVHEERAQDGTEAADAEGDAFPPLPTHDVREELNEREEAGVLDRVSLHHHVHDDVGDGGGQQPRLVELHDFPPPHPGDFHRNAFLRAQQPLLLLGRPVQFGFVFFGALPGVLQLRFVLDCKVLVVDHFELRRRDRSEHRGHLALIHGDLVPSSETRISLGVECDHACLLLQHFAELVQGHQRVAVASDLRGQDAELGDVGDGAVQVVFHDAFQIVEHFAGLLPRSNALETIFCDHGIPPPSRHVLPEVLPAV
mmetsp:Transcript_30255/g.100256  ORF Transcript_30255/g.100256 Transcript_30255/m.100256 type:complete len:268 (-) Transcript_30255:850-1653(-)